MKALFLSIAVVLIASFQLKAQTQDTTLVITFESLVHDYGTIQQGADGSCEFVFANTGKTPLVLSNVRASCGCTVPTWPKEPILPGAKSSIKVVYNTNNVGNFQKAITVNSNAKNAEVILTIKGNVEAKKQ